MSVYDQTIASVTRDGPSVLELDRIRAKMKSDLYDQLEIPISRASTLSHAVLFDGNADSIYALPHEIAKVTSSEVRAFAAKYLVRTNRTLIYRVPESKGAEAEVVQ